MDYQRLPLPELVRRCRETSDEQDAYRYELLRRAISEVDEHAWVAVVGLFRGVVLANLRRHPWAGVGDDDDVWVNRTFERFWKAIGPGRFAAFPNLASLLAYLKTCVHSVVVSDVRSFTRTPTVVPLETAEEFGDTAEVERDVLNELALRDLWNAVNDELADDDERLLVRLTFVLDMKPAEIRALHGDRFPTMAALYRVKRNAVDRLRRSSRLRKFLE